MPYPSSVSYPITESRTLERAEEFVIVAALDLMRKHGLTKEGWSFAINENRSTCGLCWFQKKRIEVSKWLIASREFDAVKNTILHEIAHALAAKKGHYKHGKVWKAIAIEIGCDGERCAEMEAPHKYKGLCPSCSRVAKSNKRSKNAACTNCCTRYNNGKWHPMFILNWQKNEESF